MKLISYLVLSFLFLVSCQVETSDQYEQIVLESTDEELAACTQEQFINSEKPLSILKGKYQWLYSVRLDKDCNPDTTFIHNKSIEFGKRTIKFYENYLEIEKVNFELKTPNQSVGPFFSILTEQENTQIDGTIRVCCNGILKIKNEISGYDYPANCEGQPAVVVLVKQ